MVARWWARKRSAGIPVLAVVLVAGAGGAWSHLARSRSGREVVGCRAPYAVVATSRWEDVDLGETSRLYARDFAPESLARQAERLDPHLDVDRLHPATIRSPEGAPGTLFLDDSGEVVLAVPFPLVRPFSGGLAPVGTAVTADRSRHIVDYGYIDRTGRLAVDPVYEDAGRFRDGPAAVRKGGRWGYIDRDGRVVIPFRYAIAEEFREGMARARPDHATVQFIARAGKVLFAGEEGSVGRFSEGLLFAVHPPRPGVGPISTWG
jgi:hypothetical protein